MADEHELPPVMGGFGPGKDGAVRVGVYEDKVMIGFENPRDPEHLIWAALDGEGALRFAGSVVKAALSTGTPPDAFLDSVLDLIRKGAQ